MRLVLIVEDRADADAATKLADRVFIEGDYDRERQCLETSPLSILRERGQATGLADYLAEVETRLLPLIDPGAHAGDRHGADDG